MLLKHKTQYSFQVNQDTSERIMTRLVYELKQRNFMVSNNDEQTLFINSDNNIGFEGWIKFKYKSGQFDISFEISHYTILVFWMIVFTISLILFFSSGLSLLVNTLIFFKTNLIMYLIYRTNTKADANKVLEIFRNSVKYRKLPLN
jgi:hypothetical protein